MIAIHSLGLLVNLAEILRTVFLLSNPPSFLCPFPDGTTAPPLKALYTYLFLLGLPLSFVCIFPSISFGHLILSNLVDFLEDLDLHSKESIISVCLIKQLYSQI